MKKILLVLAISCFALIASSQLFASCGSCGRPAACGNACPYETECMCTDPGADRHNPCLSRCEYCEAFGNVGRSP
jgi:hypothetical protein